MKTSGCVLMSLVFTASVVCQMSAAAILSVQAKNVFKDAEQLQLLDALALSDFTRANELLGRQDVNTTGADGETALWWQANVGNFEAFDYLLKKGASPIVQVRNSYNVLELSAAQPDPRFLKEAIAHGANVNMVSLFERGTPLLMAVQHRNKANVELLIKAGACVNIGDTMGTTPLLWALQMKAFDIGLLLLKNGAIPDFKSRQGYDAQAAIRDARVNSSDPEYQSFIEVRELLQTRKR